MEWKYMFGFDLPYEINNKGEIRIPKDGRYKYLKATVRESGNMQYGLKKNGKYKSYNAHVLVSEIFNNYKPFVLRAKEEIKPIVGFDGYFITNFGRIISFGKFYDRRDMSYADHIEIKPNDNGKGYKQLSVKIKGKRKTEYVHRLVLEHFSKKTEGKNYVNHIDGDKGNNHINNLEYCTQEENIKHAYKTGLMKKGSESPLAKLKVEEVNYIKKNFKKGVDSAVELGKKFGVSNNTILRVANNVTYLDII